MKRKRRNVKYPDASPTQIPYFLKMARPPDIALIRHPKNEQNLYQKKSKIFFILGILVNNNGSLTLQIKNKMPSKIFFIVGILEKNVNKSLNMTPRRKPRRKPHTRRVYKFRVAATDHDANSRRKSTKSKISTLQRFVE